MADVYWKGQNGNIYWKTEGGVRDMGQLLPGGQLLDSGVSGAQGGSFQAPGGRIQDPALASSPAPSGGGGGGGETPVLNEAAVRNTQRTINQIPGLLAHALRVEQRRLNNAINQFNAEEQTQRKTYDESTVTNQQNYDQTFMDSIRAGIQGLGGLMNILRGTGAAGGTVEGDVQDVVGGITAKDIRTGADTQGENQTELDNVLSTFLTDLKGKRQENRDTFENNQRAVRRDSNTQLQDLYGKMAGFYRDADQINKANTWMDRAGDLTPKIARNSRTKLSKYDTNPIKVRSPELTAFAEPSQPDAVSVPEDGQVGSGIFTISDRNRRRDREEEPAGV